MRIVITGDIDAGALSRFRSTVNRALLDEPVWLEFDLDGVTFFSGAAVEVVVRAYRALCGRVRVVEASAPVRRMVRMLNAQYLLSGPDAG